MSTGIRGSNLPAGTIVDQFFGLQDEGGGIKTARRFPYATVKDTLKADILSALVANASFVNQVYTLGDSMTFFGYYQSKLQTLLGSSWNVVNSGVGSQWTAQIIDRYVPEVSSHNDMKDFILLAGINDLNLYATGGNPAGLNSGNVVSTVETNLQILYTAAKAAGATVVALTLPPIKGYATWTSDLQTKQDAINSWIKTTATNVDYVIDVYALLLDPANANKYLPAYDSGDHLHFNQAGGDVIGQAIYDAVTFTLNVATTKISVTRNTTFLDQNLRMTDNVRFLSFGAGRGPSVAAAITARSRSAVDDEFQFLLEQSNLASTGWAQWASIAGDLEFCRLDTGILRAATLKLLYGATSILTGKFQILEDTTPLRVTTATFNGVNGVGVDLAPDGTSGFELITYSAGGTTFGTQKYSASQHLFKIGGVTKFSIGVGGQVNMQYLPVYANNAAATALAVGDMYVTSTGQLMARY